MTATIEKTVAEVMEAAGMVWVAVVEIARVWRWGRRDCGNGVGDSDRFGDVGGRGGNTRDGNNRDGKRWQGRGCGLCRFASFRIGLCQSTLVCVYPYRCVRRSMSVCVGPRRPLCVRVGMCPSMSVYVGRVCLNLSESVCACLNGESMERVREKSQGSQAHAEHAHSLLSLPLGRHCRREGNVPPSGGTALPVRIDACEQRQGARQDVRR